MIPIIVKPKKMIGKSTNSMYFDKRYFFDFIVLLQENSLLMLQNFDSVALSSLKYSLEISIDKKTPNKEINKKRLVIKLKLFAFIMTIPINRSAEGIA